MFKPKSDCALTCFQMSCFEGSFISSNKKMRTGFHTRHGVLVICHVVLCVAAGIANSNDSLPNSLVHSFLSGPSIYIFHTGGYPVNEWLTAEVDEQHLQGASILRG